MKKQRLCNFAEALLFFGGAAALRRCCGFAEVLRFSEALRFCGGAAALRRC
ncbi:MAG: hypothetical protein IJ453_03775 [Oscillospiraceae bacterium]|nr:hypothetical protein [Oscillospiraceae bacterium]